MFEHHHALIAPYVVGPIAVEVGKYSQLNSLDAFRNSIQPLKDHIMNRHLLVEEFLH
jgi:hypothetical protein